MHYTIKRKDLDKLLKIKGFDKYLTIPHSTSLNNTNNTNITNYTNIPKKEVRLEKIHTEESKVSEVSSVKNTPKQEDEHPKKNI